jgi:hypothetical protein
VHQDLRVRQRVPLPRRARGQQELTHRRGHAHGVGRDVVRDVLHDVVNGHARVDRAARGVDVDADVAPGVLGREQHDLAADAVGDVVVYLLAEEDYAVPQQPLEQRVPERLDRRFRRGHDRWRCGGPQGLSHTIHLLQSHLVSLSGP